MRITVLKTVSEEGTCYHWVDPRRNQEGAPSHLLLKEVPHAYFGHDKEGRMALHVPPGSRDREGNLLRPAQLAMSAEEAITLGFATVPFDPEERP